MISQSVERAAEKAEIALERQKQRELEALAAKNDNSSGTSTSGNGTVGGSNSKPSSSSGATARADPNPQDSGDNTATAPDKLEKGKSNLFNERSTNANANVEPLGSSISSSVDPTLFAEGSYLLPVPAAIALTRQNSTLSTTSNNGNQGKGKSSGSGPKTGLDGKPDSELERQLPWKLRFEDEPIIVSGMWALLRTVIPSKKVPLSRERRSAEQGGKGKGAGGALVGLAGLGLSRANSTAAGKSSLSIEVYRG